MFLIQNHLQDLTNSELLSLVLKERVRLGMAPEGNATQKRKKQGNEDTRVSYPAKKSREIGSSTHEALPNAIAPGPLECQPSGSMSFPMTLLSPSHMHTSSDAAGSIRVSPYSSQYQSLDSGLTWPALAPSIIPQDYHPHHDHSANSLHRPSVSIDPTALIGPSTLLQGHYRERTPPKTRPKKPGPSQVHAFSGGNTITSNSETRLPGAGKVTSQIILPHSGNVAAFQEILRLNQENQLLRECLSKYNSRPSGIHDHDGSRSLLSIFTAPPASPRPTAPPSRDDNSGMSEPHMPTPGPEVVPITGANPADVIVTSQHGTSGHDASVFASSFRSEKQNSTEIMRTKSPLTEGTAIGSPSGDVQHLMENQISPNTCVSISSEKNRKPIEPTGRHLGFQAYIKAEPLDATEVPRRLNQSHFAIMFYSSSSDMLCRSCLYVFLLRNAE
jgi:hypothetical protein